MQIDKVPHHKNVAIPYVAQIANNKYTGISRILKTIGKADLIIGITPTINPINSNANVSPPNTTNLRAVK